MFGIRRFAKSCIVLFLGGESRPRKIVRGLASGYRIRVSPRENLGYLFGTAEPHLQQIIRKYVRTGDTVYDIGANVGYVSLSLRSALETLVSLSHSSRSLKMPILSERM